MILLPAIDLLDAKVVRLQKGSFDNVTVYSENPLQVAKDFEYDGASYIHVVDLSGSRDGSTINYDVIKNIVREVNVKVQVGGGIRNYERAVELINLGVDRIILGTVAVDNLPLLEKLVNEFGEKICVSLDVFDEFVATNAWEDVSDVHIIDLCNKLMNIGVKTIVCTDIKKDGMLMGPSVELYKLLKEKTNLNIIVSGGISSLDDIGEVRDLGLYGVISGKAIYENRFTVKEAVMCLRKE